MLAYLGLGLSMGLSAGISPGPLLALVISASVRSGLAGGLRVALAPFVTDLPIILLAVLLAGSLPPEALRWVGTVGGLVVIWMGIEAVRSARDAALPEGVGDRDDSRRELWRGVAVNALNPHPYLFWATVGGPALVSGYRVSPWYVLAFLAPFYLVLVGSKMIVAWVVSRRAGGLSLDWYRRVLVGCGVLMMMMGAVL
ncbi:MAG: LysE family translocator, partial [Anaerolineae bacterium]